MPSSLVFLVLLSIYNVDLYHCSILQTSQLGPLDSLCPLVYIPQQLPLYPHIPLTPPLPPGWNDPCCQKVLVAQGLKISFSSNLVAVLYTGIHKCVSKEDDILQIWCVSDGVIKKIFIPLSWKYIQVHFFCVSRSFRNSQLCSYWSSFYYTPTLVSDIFCKFPNEKKSNKIFFMLWFLINGFFWSALIVWIYSGTPCTLA